MAHYVDLTNKEWSHSDLWDWSHCPSDILFSCWHLTTPLCNRQLPHEHFVSLGVNTATEWSALRRMLLEEIWSQPRKWALEREWGLWVGIFTGPVDSFPPGELQPKWTRGEPSKGTSLNLFGTSNWFCRRQFFPWTRAREWFWDDPSTLHLLYTSLILLLHQLHLRSSSTRSQGLGTLL